ncbi:MAG: AAA family ATPase, partial [Chloroflexota bacterium]
KGYPTRAHRLIAVAPATSTLPRRLSAPMVGRSQELGQLTNALELVVTQPRTHLFSIIGGAGVGKSRLIREFLASLDGRARVLRGRCLPYGAGITYWPILEIAQSAASIGADDSPDEARRKLASLVTDAAEATRVGDSLSVAIGLSRDAIPTAEIAWAVRKMLELLASREPLVVVLDDLQWAEPALLDLVEETARWARDSHLLLVCMARPDLLDRRPGWGGGMLNATTLALEPLSATEADRLIDELIGGPAISGAVAERIVEAAEGNPLYVEEMIGMLIDRGVLTAADGGWLVTGDASGVQVPPTIHALLGARLDALPAAERTLAQRGAIIGRVFEQVAVHELSPEPDRQTVADNLRELTRHEVISAYGADDVFRFRHLLIRDAAYAALPKEERASLHERYATWLEATAGDRVAEYEEVLGYHLEQAHDYRRELGQHGRPVDDLAKRAGRWLGSAGQRAIDRRDLKAARGILLRASRIAPPGDPNHWTVTVALANVFQDTEGADQSAPLYAAILAAARDPAIPVPPEVAAEARYEAAWLSGERNELTGAEVRKAIGAELRGLVRGGQFRLAVAAWRRIGELYKNDVDLQRAERAARRAAKLSAWAGDRNAEAQLLLDLINLGIRSAMPVNEAIGLVDRLLAIDGLDHGMRVRGSEHLAFLLALGGRFDEARTQFVETRAALTELGDVDALADVTLTQARTEEEAGDYAAAEAFYRAAMKVGDQGGWTGWTAGAAGRLAHVLIALGRDEGAEILAARAIAEDLTPWGAQFGGTAQARILARRGYLPEAIRLARQTLAGSSAAGFESYPIIFGQAVETLAAVLAADVQLDEARGTLRDLLVAYRAKGYVPGVGRVEQELARLGDLPV